MSQRGIFTHVISDDVDDWDMWFLGRAPLTRETLPDFRESCQVALYSRVFRRLTGSQWTPRVWGVTIPLLGDSLPCRGILFSGTGSARGDDSS